MSRKLCFIFGTRPEIIKLSPLIKLCRKRRVSFFCIHSGQHYSYDLDKVFFKELELPAPEYKLAVRSKAPYRQGEHTGKMLIALEEILLKEMPYCVVVQGDTNTVLAGALTAEKISTTESYTGFHIKVAHVEAGLRSFDRSMPEETNRFIADHLSDFLFVPAPKEKEILLKEGVPRAWIHVTGNTIVDAVKDYIQRAQVKSSILPQLDLKKGSYLLLTLHRQENVDDQKVFSDILKGLERVVSRLHMPIVFPIHPRTLKRLERFNLTLPVGVMPVEPLGFFDFLMLEANAALALTDSGGVQEETCILKVPCVTIRENTERPETVAVGSNLVAGTRPGSILRAAEKMLRVKRNWKNPLGDGLTSQRILKILLS
ncbi:MAG TPA: UDP-N-acetylglucosamine 2-epimerase (non-hydrolyzing) [Candidatus Margulisiibacteriota bacterium]|nr:UDP-N-acetylglucosamine 2-epimerase (non-hydrolyzing) [Candidatus Margulisiibacteriota bacterium]